ncbi:hypothetical protein [Phormidium sp. CCY1219]|uniref:hypothetical protein n=1 Tax=Phormidium sp. CCY1219 TaxID=2886104 RepID=UPI002D1F99CD|nr:hypothetical protein [Phormidium sp. CCY1219]MEB3828546.1 hypothetical protein [Phormidium sp. CCY1219]
MKLVRSWLRIVGKQLSAFDCPEDIFLQVISAHFWHLRGDRLLLSEARSPFSHYKYST